jgi:ketosteroid isomerase-like protein
MDDILKHIRNLETARFSAMKEGDVAALKVLLDDDLIYVHSNGRIDGKAEYLETLRQGTIHYEAIQVKGDRHQISKDSAVLVQSLIATMRVGVGAELVTRHMVLMSVWGSNSTGHWTLRAMQSTADTHDC